MKFELDECLNGKLITFHSHGMLTEGEKEFFLNNVVVINNNNILNDVVNNTVAYFKWIENNDIVVEFAVALEHIGSNRTFSCCEEFYTVSKKNSLVDYLGIFIKESGCVYLKYYKNDIEKRLLENVVTENDKKKEFPENIISESEINHLRDSFVNVIQELSVLQSEFNKNKKNIEYSYNELNEKIYKTESRIDTITRSIDVLLATQQTILNITERMLKNG